MTGDCKALTGAYLVVLRDRDGRSRRPTCVPNCSQMSLLKQAAKNLDMLFKPMRLYPILALLLGLGASLFSSCTSSREGVSQEPLKREATGQMDPKADSDYDGRANAQEQREGTDPKDPKSVRFVRLAYWRFNDSSMEGLDGQQPMDRQGVGTVPSFSGKALRLNPEVSDARLRYRAVEPDGDANINLRSGAVRFWFRPDWSSGEGPGANAQLIGVGKRSADASYGYWGAYVNPEGTHISFVTEAGGRKQRHVRAKIDWKEGGWYEILLAYTPSFVAVEVNDERLRPTGTGIAPIPPRKVRNRSGISLGSNLDGNEPARGAFDELETFNYRPGAAIDRYSLDFTLSASVRASPPRVHLEWKNKPSESVIIKRRRYGQQEWTTLATDYQGWSYTDAGDLLSPGERYEYLIHPDPYDPAVGALFDRYVVCDIAPEIVHDRGHVLLLVDETLAPQLDGALTQFRKTLVGDGWQVSSEIVPRHDDDVWSNNPPRIERVKKRVEKAYKAHGDHLKAVMLLGHVPIPFSGHMRPDGHHDRPWPVDFYYGDTVYEPDDWTDKRRFEGRRDRLRNIPPVPNRAGDGKFDQQRFPSSLEVAVGRIDFANLPAVGASEVALLKRYLRKNRRYRRDQLNFPKRAAATGFMGGGKLGGDPNRLIYSYALKNVSAWFGLNQAHLRQVDCFRDNNRYLWGFQFGAGYYDEIGVGNRVHGRSARDFRSPDKAYPAFYILDGSYFGEWHQPDNLLRSVLAPRDSGLLSIWGRWFKQRWQSLALGDTMGSSVLHAVNHLGEHNYVLAEWTEGYNLHIAILGDPTLRLYPVPPPHDLRGRRSPEGVRLQWAEPAQDDGRYFVYRSSDGINGAFERLTPALLKSSQFIDPDPPDGKLIYQVRTAREVSTGSGRFTNLSQASFVGIP